MNTRILSLVAGLLIGLTTPALAQEPVNIAGPLKKCASLTDRAERLQCFDQIAVSQQLMSADNAAKQKQIMEQIGLWRVQTQQDETGRTVIYLKTQATTPITLVNGLKQTPTLTVRCREKKTDVYMDWNAPLTSSDSGIKTIFVKSRLDEDITVDRDWELSLDKKAAFAPEAVNYVRAMKDAKKISLEFTPIHEGAVVALFDLTGFKGALDTLVRKCYN